MSGYRFNRTARAFSKINLVYLAHCSNLVYKSQDEIGSWLREQGFNLERNNFFFSSQETEKENTQCFVVGDHKKIVIAFRGTENQTLDDWGTNAQISKVDWPEENPIGRVHSGFLNGLNDVWPEMVEEIKTLRDNNQPVWLTGHSLGGALATLAATSLTFGNYKPEVAGLYTFGQPRVGDNQFAISFNDALKKRSFRLVNNNDVVTRVPPRLFGYRHIGTLKYFDNDGKLLPDGKLTWWGKFWDRVEGGIESALNLELDIIEDHSMNDYEDLVTTV